MKKVFNLFSATLSKVFNDFVPFGHQVRWTFFTSLPQKAMFSD